MSTRPLTCLCLWAVVMVVPSAATAQNREHQQLFADLRILQEQTQQLRLSVASLVEALTALDTKVDGQAGLTRKLFADQGLVIDALTDNARILREKLDATNVSLSKDSHELETMRQELAAQRTLLTQIIALLTPPPAPVDPEAVAADAAGATTTPPPTPAFIPPTVPPPPQNPQRAFDAAFGDYAIGQYDMAIAGFEYYIKAFPTSPDAPKARLFIGEAYYKKGAYQEAVIAYGQVITIDKGSPQEPEALYKQGLAYESMGQLDRAKASWELLIRTFPDSSAYMLATQGLARIIK